MFEPKPVTLATNRIQLQPLTLDHSAALHLAANDDSIWQWVVPNPHKNIIGSQQWIQQALDQQQANQRVPFVIIDNASGALVGCTSYCGIERQDKGIEIGHTFISAKYHRSYVNTHAKYCLLKHAFEQLGAIRVQFKTHEHNQRSRNAIARIGASFEGIIRNQRILPDGNLRNTALFSIISQEWPAVRQQLENKLDNC